MIEIYDFPHVLDKIRPRRAKTPGPADPADKGTRTNLEVSVNGPPFECLYTHDKASVPSWGRRNARLGRTAHSSPEAISYALFP